MNKVPVDSAARLLPNARVVEPEQRGDGQRRLSLERIVGVGGRKVESVSSLKKRTDGLDNTVSFSASLVM